MWLTTSIGKQLLVKSYFCTISVFVHFSLSKKSVHGPGPKPFYKNKKVSMDPVFEIITDQSSIACYCCCFFNLIFALFLFLFSSHYLKKVSMDPVHNRGSMDPVHESGPWTRSKVGVHGPLVHVLSSPLPNIIS